MCSESRVADLLTGTQKARELNELMNSGGVRGKSLKERILEGRGIPRAPLGDRSIIHKEGDAGHVPLQQGLKCH